MTQEHVFIALFSRKMYRSLCKQTSMTSHFDLSDGKKQFGIGLSFPVLMLILLLTWWWGMKKAHGKKGNIVCMWSIFNCLNG